MVSSRSALRFITLCMVVVCACAPSSQATDRRTLGAGTVLVAIGASDAVGIGAANPDQDSWVARLGARLPHGARVVNLGISGATAAQAATQELPIAQDAAPTDVVVWLGVNDVMQNVPLETFSQNLSRIVNAVRSQTGARVFVANLPDLKSLPALQNRNAGDLDATVAAWNGSIAAVAGEAGAKLVDVYTAWNALPERASLVSADGLHPNSAGYQRLADLFWQTMRAG